MPLSLLGSAVLFSGGIILLSEGRSRRDIVEALKNPLQVTGWSAEGLLLKDGRLLKLPGTAPLPDRSRALSEAVKRGVEVGEDGRVYGLVKVHHWCGNDPVRDHIARVDLRRMLEFLSAHEPDYGDDCFSESGWSFNAFYGFRQAQLGR
jgi:hypothetical protein